LLVAEVVVQKVAEVELEAQVVVELEVEQQEQVEQQIQVVVEGVQKIMDPQVDQVDREL
jgi:hypothetical protein|tara:strand:- start:141 stop:317 length:177 start_codon:yes stop_codon:yes gene_type:complete